jgi:hypothetical protein
MPKIEKIQTGCCEITFCCSRVFPLAAEAEPVELVGFCVDQRVLVDRELWCADNSPNGNMGPIFESKRPFGFTIYECCDA